MNLSYAPARRLSPFHAARPAALAILYPKVGNVLRVPLRRTPTAGGQGCAQHPERQLMQWFTRMAAARPGFPMQLKSILLLTGEPLCPGCYRALARYLGQYQLAGKLRVRSRGEAANCGCGGFDQAAHQSATPLLLDDILLEGELEQEGWWQRAKDLGRAALLTGAITLGPQVVSKPVYDMAKAAAQADEQRRKMQQTVDDNAPPSSRRQRELALELEMEQETLVMHERIDVHAQYSLQRLMSSPDPATRVDGNILLGGVRGGRVRGIFIVNQLEPAKWARSRGGDWWALLQPTDDAALLLSAGPPFTNLAPSIIAFRESIRSTPGRLDPALRRAAQLLRQIDKLKADNPSLTPWQLKSILTPGEPLPTTAPGSDMAAVVGITRAA
jgi:hypothetical protein